MTNSQAFDEATPIFVTDTDLAHEYDTNGIFSRIIDSLPEDSVRHGFELGISDDKITGFIFNRLDDLEAVQKLTDAMKLSRLFGGSIAVMFIDDGNELEQPLDIKSVYKIADIRVYDRTQAIPDYASAYKFNAAKPWKTGEPEFYDVTLDTGGQFHVHESRCLKFTNGKLVSQTNYNHYQFWGLPEYYRVERPLKNYVKAHNAIAKMMERSSIPIFKANMTNVLSADREGIMRTAIRQLSRMLRFDRTVGIDKDTEDFSYASASFSGTQEAIRAAMSDLSAVSRHPQTKLFGSSPGGLQATGESDTENWHSEVESWQELHYKKPLLEIIDIIIQEGIFSGKLKERPEMDFKFNPLKVLSDLEQAQLDLQKMQVAKQKADIATVYCDLGSLDPGEIRKGLAEDSEYSIEDLLDEDAGAVDNGLPNLSRLIQEISAKPLNVDVISVKLRHDEKQRFITINGAAVPVDSDGNLQGEVGAKIMESSENNIAPTTVQEVMKQYGLKVKGAKSACGLTVGDISKHAASRIIERNVTETELLNIITESQITYPGNEPNTICQQHGDLRIVFNDVTGKIISIVRLEED